MSDKIRDTIISECSVYLSMTDEQYRRCLSQYDSPATLLNSLYNYSVADKELDPIENLPTEEKQSFWLEANRLKPGVDKTKLIQISKALYLKSRL